MQPRSDGRRVQPDGMYTLGGQLGGKCPGKEPFKGSPPWVTQVVQPGAGWLARGALAIDSAMEGERLLQPWRVDIDSWIHGAEMAERGCIAWRQ